MIGLYILLIGALVFVLIIGGIAIHQIRHKTNK